MADNSIILKHIPGGVLYHVDLPPRNKWHKMLSTFVELPLARVPVTNNGANFKSNIPINFVAAFLNATGWAAGADTCGRCHPGSGQFLHCVYPYLEGQIRVLSLSCSTCFYQYEASRCTKYMASDRFKPPGMIAPSSPPHQLPLSLQLRPRSPHPTTPNHRYSEPS